MIERLVEAWEGFLDLHAATAIRPAPPVVWAEDEVQILVACLLSSTHGPDLRIQADVPVLKGVGPVDFLVTERTPRGEGHVLGRGSPVALALDVRVVGTASERARARESARKLGAIVKAGRAGVAALCVLDRAAPSDPPFYAGLEGSFGIAVRVAFEVELAARRGSRPCGSPEAGTARGPVVPDVPDPEGRRAPPSPFRVFRPFASPGVAAATPCRRPSRRAHDRTPTACPSGVPRRDGAESSAVRPSADLSYVFDRMEQIEAERRRADRIPDDAPVLLVRSLGDPDVRSGRVRDLSGGGACVLAEEAFPAGTVIYVGFFLPNFGGLPLIARVRVAWTRHEDVFQHAMGLTFLADGPAQRDAVERMRDYLAARRRALVAA